MKTELIGSLSLLAVIMSANGLVRILIPMVDGVLTSIGFEKVAVKSTLPHFIETIVLMEVNFKRSGPLILTGFGEYTQ